MSNINIFIGGKPDNEESELLRELKKKKDNKDNKMSESIAAQTGLLSKLLSELKSKSNLEAA